MIASIVQFFARIYKYLTIRGYYSARKEAKKYLYRRTVISDAGRTSRYLEIPDEVVHYFIIKREIERKSHISGNQENTVNEEVGRKFLEAAERGDANTIKIFLSGDFPSSWQHPKTGLTALHITASNRATNALRVLLEYGHCDFLVRDNRGRLPSEMAYLYGEDVELSQNLGRRERRQAAREGVQLTRRPT